MPQYLSPVLSRLRKLTSEIPALRDTHNVRVVNHGGALYISLHCVFDGALNIDEVHRLSSRIEHDLKEHVPGVEDVHIHVEPQD